MSIKINLNVLAKVIYKRLPVQEKDKWGYYLRDEKLHNFLVKKGLVFLGMGRHRATYRLNNFVIKIPLGIEGIQANFDEAAICKKKSNTFPVAQCYFLDPICVMEEIKTDMPFAAKPKWAYTIDMGQVGLNKYYEFVAYDYAL